MEEEDDICCAAVRMLPRPTLPQNKYYFYFLSLSLCFLSLSLDFVFPKTVWRSTILFSKQANGDMGWHFLASVYDVGFFRELMSTPTFSHLRSFFLSLFI